jgi:hypothetical protein
VSAAQDKGRGWLGGALCAVGLVAVALDLADLAGVSVPQPPSIVFALAFADWDGTPA